MRIEICILAGGLSTRMGRDKSRIRLGRSTMLRLIRELASGTGLNVRVLRRDLVPRSGPLGGIYSALKTTRADAVVFLACDMPFVREEMIRKVTEIGIANPGRAVFFTLGGKLTFPFLIPRPLLAEVTRCLERGKLSIQSLGKSLSGKALRCPRKWLRCLDNINTPEDLGRAKQQLGNREISGCSPRGNMLS